VLFCAVDVCVCVCVCVRACRGGQVVFFTFWQSVTLAILVRIGLIHATETYTEEDIVTSLQDFMICIEMFLAALVHHLAFSYKDFHDPDITARPHAPVRAILHAVNVTDIYVHHVRDVWSRKKTMRAANGTFGAEAADDQAVLYDEPLGAIDEEDGRDWMQVKHSSAATTASMPRTSDPVGLKRPATQVLVDSSMALPDIPAAQPSPQETLERAQQRQASSNQYAAIELPSRGGLVSGIIPTGSVGVVAVSSNDDASDSDVEAGQAMPSRRTLIPSHDDSAQPDSDNSTLDLHVDHSSLHDAN